MLLRFRRFISHLPSVEEGEFSQIKLKAYKNIDRGELVRISGVNQSYVTLVINLLRERGYKIDSILGSYGGYEYKGYDKPKYKYRKLNDVEIKGIINLYKNGVVIGDIEEITGKSKVCIFYQLNKNKINLDRNSRVDSEKLKSLYYKGYSLKEMANLVDVEYGTLTKTLYRYVDANRRGKNKRC